MKNFLRVIDYLPERIKNILKRIPEALACQIEEIRLRVNCPIILTIKGRGYFLTQNAHLLTRGENSAISIFSPEIEDIYKKMCKYSVYSYQQQIAQGFLTLCGGHRVGLCGTAISKENKAISIKNITSMNIRIARNKPGCAEEIMDLTKQDFCGMLLVGEPGCGKTTILREVAKKLSLPQGQQMKKIVIIDERNEFAGVSEGIPYNDIGYCDVLNGFAKEDGITLAIRNLAPHLIICDEISTTEDVKAIRWGLNSGVGFISSLHAGSLKEFLDRGISRMLIDTNGFSHIVIMKGSHLAGEVQKVYRLEEIKNEIDRKHDNNGYINSNGLSIIA